MKLETRNDDKETKGRLNEISLDLNRTKRIFEEQSNRINENVNELNGKVVGLVNEDTQLKTKILSQQHRLDSIDSTLNGIRTRGILIIN